MEKAKPLGTLHIMLSECSDSLEAASKCTGLGETTGTILVLATFHIVHVLLAGVLSGAILILITTPVHSACTVFGLTLSLIHI